MSKLTQKELESQLDNAVNIFRKLIGNSRFCINYVIVILFIKRLSDVFEEEAEKILEETGDKDLAYNEPDEHIFYVPEQARWSNLKSFYRDIGNKLNIAVNALEDANSPLKNALTIVDFNDKWIFKRNANRFFWEIIHLFSHLNLCNKNFSEPDVFQQGFIFLVKQMKTDRMYYTPYGISKLLILLLDIKEEMRVCDPFCGSGDFLIESAKYIEKQGGNPQNISLFGQDMESSFFAITKLNMIANNILDFDIAKGDSISEPCFIKEDKLMLFDRVISNPFPLVPNYRHQEVINNDRFQRFIYGLPSQKSEEYLALQHIISSLNSQGRAAVLIYTSCLSRGGKEKNIRQKILEDDLIETIISLPSKICHLKAIPFSVLLFNKNKPINRKNKVLFIDSREEYQPNKYHNYLRDKDIQHIVNTHQEFKEETRYSSIVSLEGIADNNYELHAARYVISMEQEEKIDIALEIKKLRQIADDINSLEELMIQNIKDLGMEI